MDQKSRTGCFWGAKLGPKSKTNKLVGEDTSKETENCTGSRVKW